MKNRTVVMFHYVKEGLVRSPNIIFDRIEKTIDHDKYQIIHLNQQHLPSEIGVFRVIKELYNEIKEKKPDIIHISGIQEGFSCMIAAFLAGCHKRILITHGFASEAEGLSRYKRTLFRHVTEPITLCLSTVVQCNSWFSYNHKLVRRFAKKRRKMIYNMPSEEQGSERRQNVRKTYGIEDDVIIYVSVGRIVKEKGFEQLAHVIPKVGSNCCFLIIGDGTYLEEMKAELKNEIKDNKVIFLGRITNEEVCVIMKECDVFVLPTLHFETYGLVYIEAAFAGLPSIGTNIYAVPEVIKDGETGKLIEPENETQLQETIEFFAKNPAKVQKMGEAAYRRAKEIFDREKIAQQIDDMYQELLR